MAGFFSAYHPLSDQEDLLLQKELAIVKPDAMREKVMQLTNPFIRLGIQQGLEKGLQQGLQQGIERGRHEGEVELILRLLKRRLGALPMSQCKLIRKLDLAKTEALGESLLEFESRSDLACWLKEHAS